jgi:hypothetical protein
MKKRKNKKANRLFLPLDRRHLRALQRIGLKEQGEYFDRNPKLETFKHKLLGICLCQGAATHYLNPKWGIADFDLWHFYLEEGPKRFPYRGHKKVKKAYKGKPVDLLKRGIPQDLYMTMSKNRGAAILAFLLRKEDILLDQAIVGLYPESLFGKVIWAGERRTLKHLQPSLSGKL